MGVLENVEKVVADSNTKEKAAKENSEKTIGRHKKGKCKGSGSKDYCIPKKVRVEKSCTLCQKHGGAHMSGNPHQSGPQHLSFNQRRTRLYAF